MSMTIGHLLFIIFYIYGFYYIQGFRGCNYLSTSLIHRSPLYPESNYVPRFGDGGKAEAALMRGKPPRL